MSSRYFYKSISLSYALCLVICYSVRPCVTIIFPRRDSSSVESYSNNDIIGTGASSERSTRFETDSANDEGREQTDSEDVLSKGWNYLDSKKPWTPHEKTISLQFLNDDGHFAHNPPAWPHDEYLLQFPYNPNFNGLTNTKNGSEQTESLTEGLNQPNESEKDYEWTRLRPRPPKGMFIGPGFYDDSSKYQTAADSSHQAITDGSSSSSASATSGTGEVASSASGSANHGKFYNAHAYDHYRRQRLRLKIHPGLLAAPIAGFAAYKAVSAFASKPLLFELGWVNNNKPDIGNGGWGWNGPIWNGAAVVPPYYPPIAPVLPLNPYPAYPIGNFSPRPGALQPQYPILRPTRNEGQKSSWWNPFAALTPRFRSKKKERTNCCDS